MAMTQSAAHRVLTDPHFFGLFTPWMTGWPGLVLHRWRAFQSTRPSQESTDDMAFTKMLVEMDDRRALQLVLSAVWRDSVGHLNRFRFSLHDAIATRNPDTVRRTLESNEWIRRNVTAWTWFTAVAYFRGDPAILDLLKSHATPAWTETRIRNQLFRKDLRVRALQLFQTADVACLQWFVDNFGLASLPSQLVLRLDERLARFLGHVVTCHKNLPQGPPLRPALASERVLAA